jgi:hypothetical protein
MQLDSLTQAMQCNLHLLDTTLQLDMLLDIRAFLHKCHIYCALKT